VTITRILPGLFDTDRLRGTTQKRGARWRSVVEEDEAAVPAGRFGSAEFGAVVAFSAGARGPSPARTCSSTAAAIRARCKRRARKRGARRSPLRQLFRVAHVSLRGVARCCGALNSNAESEARAANA
jgi:hypothetical protein